MADEVAGEVRGDRERVDVDNCSWRAGCARVSGEGESLEQAVVTLKSNAPHLLGWGPEMEDEGMGSWMWEVWWDLWDLICWMGGWLDWVVWRVWRCPAQVVSRGWLESGGLRGGGEGCQGLA